MTSEVTSYVVRQRAKKVGMKFATLAGIIALLQIPAFMINGVVDEREERRHEAQQDIRSLFGNPIEIETPILRVSYEQEPPAPTEIPVGDTRDVHPQQPPTTKRGDLFLYPSTLRTSAGVTHEVRSRGIFDFPVFTGKIQHEGVFDIAALKRRLPAGARITWEGLELLVGVDCAAQGKQMPVVRLRGQEHDMEPREKAGEAGGSACMSRFLTGEVNEDTLPFTLSMTATGTESVSFHPFAKKGEVHITSTWPHISSIGAPGPHLSRSDSEGSEATWQLSSANTVLTGDELSAASRRSVGVAFVSPIDAYRMTVRAAKYEILFIVLVFATFYVSEVVLGLRLHPVQYFLVGFAMVLFFLILLAAGEHLPFGLAYTAASLVASALVTGYSRAVLKAAGRSWIVGALMGSLYTFLYTVLESEQFALLLGTTGLTALLAIVMYVTREIDWYGEENEVSSR